MSHPDPSKEYGENEIQGWIDEAEQLRHEEEMKIDYTKPLPSWMSEEEVMKEAGREFQRVRTQQILNNIVRPMGAHDLEKL